MTEEQMKARIRELEDIQADAYLTALSLMSGGNIAPRLHKLLCLLECRDLLRRKRREEQKPIIIRGSGGDEAGREEGVEPSG